MPLIQGKNKTIIVLAVTLCFMLLLGYRLFWSYPSVPVARVIEGEIQGTIHGPGTVQSRIPVTVSSKITGILEKVYVDQGDAVTKGQLLAELDTRELLSLVKASRSALTRFERDIHRAQATRAKTSANLTLARSNYRRDTELFEDDVISEADMDATRAALQVAESEHDEAAANLSAIEAGRDQAVSEVHVSEANLEYTQITAPMDGLIIDRTAEAGDTIVPAAPIFHMVDLNTIWVAAWIDETRIAHLREGQKATIRLRSGRHFQGTVVRINRQADTVTRELEVDVQLKVLPDPLVIGEEAEVVITADRTKGLVLPLSSIFLWQGTNGVLTVRDSRAHFTPVTLEVYDRKKALITGKLQPGDLVVLQPAGTLVNKKVQPALQPWPTAEGK